MSLNLHAIVRGAISSVNADEQVYLLQSTGNTNVSGRIVATYAGPQLVGAQVQTLSNDDLKIVSETERTERSKVLSVQRFEQPNHPGGHNPESRPHRRLYIQTLRQHILENLLCSRRF